ncbi:MAG: hypothetical protein WBD74_04960 [Candidatus Aquilonibacter sp.]
MLFKDAYPYEYSYFKLALEADLRSAEETFRFADGNAVGYSGSTPLLHAYETAVVDLDASGNLLSVERAPD